MLSGALAIGGCGRPDGAVHTAVPGTISGVVHYDGPAAARGRVLAIAVYRSFPPVGPPVATQLIERYTLPYKYEFNGLPPGTYHVGALIDVDRQDSRHAGMLVRGTDPHGYAAGGGPIVVALDRGVAGVDVLMQEPAK